MLTRHARATIYQSRSAIHHYLATSQTQSFLYIFLSERVAFGAVCGSRCTCTARVCIQGPQGKLRTIFCFGSRTPPRSPPATAPLCCTYPQPPQHLLRKLLLPPLLWLRALEVPGGGCRGGASAVGAEECNRLPCFWQVVGQRQFHNSPYLSSGCHPALRAKKITRRPWRAVMMEYSVEFEGRGQLFMMITCSSGRAIV